MTLFAGNDLFGLYSAKKGHDTFCCCIMTYVNEGLARSNDRLKEENTVLREQNKDYSLLRKVFGNKQIDDLVGQAREAQRAKRLQRQRSYEYER